MATSTLRVQLIQYGAAIWSQKCDSGYPVGTVLTLLPYTVHYCVRAPLTLLILVMSHYYRRR
jgi:hypothetical protein